MQRYKCNINKEGLMKTLNGYPIIKTLDNYVIIKKKHGYRIVNTETGLELSFCRTHEKALEALKRCHHCRW